jgi:hypothetical protein
MVLKFQQFQIVATPIIENEGLFQSIPNDENEINRSAP